MHKLLFLASLVVFSLSVLAPAQLGPKTPPTVLIITAPPLRERHDTYNFEVAISASREGQGQLNAVTTVTKVSHEQTVRFRDIRLKISPDAPAFSVVLDGKTFVVEAQYTEPSEDETDPPRFALTTYGTMFGGGRVGITVRAIS